jgi:hypothetical protein
MPEHDYACVFKSDIPISKILKDIKCQGFQIGMDQGRNNMKAYVLYLLNQFGQDIENICCQEVRESYFRLVKKIKEMK